MQKSDSLKSINSTPQKGWCGRDAPHSIVEIGYNEKLLFCDKRPRRKKREIMTFGVRKMHDSTSDQDGCKGKKSYHPQ